MIRSYLLTIFLLFACVTPLHGMKAAGSPKSQDNSIAVAILRDASRGGLTVPALLANGIALFGTTGNSEMEVHSKMTLGFMFIGISVVMHILGLHFSVKEGHPTDYARNARNLFKCCYGALALYCIVNAV